MLISFYTDIILYGYYTDNNLGEYFCLFIFYFHRLFFVFFHYMKQS